MENKLKCSNCGIEITPQNLGAKRKIRGKTLILCKNCYRKKRKEIPKKLKEKYGYQGELIKEENGIWIELINKTGYPEFVKDFLQETEEKGDCIIDLAYTHLFSYAKFCEEDPGEFFSDLGRDIKDFKIKIKISEVKEFLNELINKYGFYDLSITTKNFIIKQNGEYNSIKIEPKVKSWEEISKILKICKYLMEKSVNKP